MRPTKSSAITGAVALFAAAGVLMAGLTDPAPFEKNSEADLVPRIDYMDKAALLNEDDEDGSPHEDEDGDEGEEKKRNGWRKKVFNFPAIGKVLAALFTELTLSKLVKKKVFWALVIVATLIIIADAALSVFSPDYREIRTFVLTFGIVVCTVTAVVTLFIKRRRKRMNTKDPHSEVLSEPEAEPETLIFIDSGGEFKINLQKSAF